jgi:hypothetical protein
LWNFRARLYDNEVGLFYAVDPAYQSWSSMGYVLGNPISFVDPTGRFGEKPDWMDPETWEFWNRFGAEFSSGIGTYGEWTISNAKNFGLDVIPGKGGHWELTANRQLASSGTPFWKKDPITQEWKVNEIEIYDKPEWVWLQDVDRRSLFDYVEEFGLAFANASIAVYDKGIGHVIVNGKRQWFYSLEYARRTYPTSVALSRTLSRVLGAGGNILAGVSTLQSFEARSESVDPASHTLHSWNASMGVTSIALSVLASPAVGAAFGGGYWFGMEISRPINRWAFGVNWPPR